MTLAEAKQIIRIPPRTHAERAIYLRALMIVAGSFAKRDT